MAASRGIGPRSHAPRAAGDSIRRCSRRRRAEARVVPDSALKQSRTLTLADLANVTWKPHRGARNLRFPYEAQPASGRAGLAGTWREFDAAVAQLGQALERDSMKRLAQAFDKIATIAASSPRPWNAASRPKATPRQADAEPGGRLAAVAAFRVTLALRVVLALGLVLVHGQFAAAGHALGSGFSSLSHHLRHDVQGAVQHPLRPVPGTR